MKMFRVNIFLCVLAIAVPLGMCDFGNIDDHPKLREVQKACRMKVPVKDEIYERALMKDLQVDDKSLQCYIKCIFELGKAMNQQGTIDMTRYISELKPDAAVFYGPKFIECQKKTDDEDLCKKAMKMYQCFQETAGDKFYFV